MTVSVYMAPSPWNNPGLPSTPVPGQPFVPMPNPALHVFPVSRAEFDSFRSQMNVTRDALLSRVAALEAALLAVKPTRKPSRRRRK